jgi:hypothetical protein
MHSGCWKLTLCVWICPHDARVRCSGECTVSGGAIAPAGARGERPCVFDQANPCPQSERRAPPRDSDLNLQYRSVRRPALRRKSNAGVTLEMTEARRLGWRSGYSDCVGGISEVSGDNSVLSAQFVYFVGPTNFSLVRESSNQHSAPYELRGGRPLFSATAQ